MSELKRSTLFRYGLAVLSVMAATALMWLLQAGEERTPFALFFVAVLFSSLYCGRGPGLVAIALSALFSSFFIIPPQFSFAIGLEGLIQLSVFLFVAFLIHYLSGRARSAEALTRDSEARLLVTLRSIGDAVIATDTRGRVTFMNPVAQQLTGWKLDDARGKELDEVFNIVNEFTCERVESPVAKVIREGVAVGLANHTLLISRGGAEIPIDDSGAPIKDKDGNITGIVLVFHDITERRRAEMAVLRLAAIVETSDDAIFTKTLNGVITSWNVGAEKLYGYKAEEVVGKSVSLLAPPERTDEVLDILRRLRAGERLEHFETVRVRKDGTRLDISLTISPLKDQAGTLIGASTIARDVTERRRAEEERARLLEREHAARLEAEEANRLKDEFLATLSHELRTPLTSMLGWTRMLRAGSLDKETSAHALETIERNVRSQTQLIEDLLDVSRIITGKLHIETKAVALVSVIEAAIDSVRPTAEAKGIELEKSMDPFAGPVLGDPARLQQVVWNLLSNAVKFTPRGGRVMVGLHRVESSAAITVTDTGAGISAEFLPYVFDRFRQADSSSTRSHGGLGLGLAIVRHMVELHGGTVSASSVGLERGASFTVQLPIMAVAPVRKASASPADGAGEAGKNSFGRVPSLEGVRVLVVDDEEDARNLLITILEQYEANVEAVATVSQAIEAVRRSKPDVIISDIGMPEEDGYSLVRRLRSLEDPHLKELPAVALTAYAGEQHRNRALSSGFQLHLSKPVEPSTLIEAVERLVRNHKPY